MLQEVVAHVMVSPVIGFVMPGGSEWIFIVLIAVLLFGANKLPELAQSAGSALGEFKKARYSAEQEVKEVKQETMEPVSEDTEAAEDDEETVEAR